MSVAIETLMFFGLVFFPGFQKTSVHFSGKKSESESFQLQSIQILITLPHQNILKQKEKKNISSAQKSND